MSNHKVKEKLEKEKEMDHICQHCDSKFKFSKTLKYHILEKHPASDAKKFFCEICGHAANTKNYLWKHNREKHERDKFKHECPICDLKFRTKQKMNIHID